MVRGIKTISNRAAVKFTEKDSFDYCRSGGSYVQEAFNRELVGTSYEQQRPSMHTADVQKELIENQVFLPSNVPSQASISRVLTSNLGYLYKKIQKRV